MLSVCVIGESGQVAQSLANLAGEDVRIVTVPRAVIDLSEVETLKAKIDTVIKAGGPFDLLINAAAYTAVDKAEEEEELATLVNGVAPGLIAEVAAQHSLSFFHISTDYVFDGDKRTPYQEDDPTNPTGAYGRSKLAGERAALAANPAALVFRTAWVFSPYGHNFLKTMLRLSERPKLTVVADQIGNPTYAPDIAAALIAAGKAYGAMNGEKPSGVFNLSGTGSTSWHGFAEAIFEHVAERPRVDAITSEEFPTPTKRPSNSRLDCQKLKDVFGVEMPYWRTSVADCLTSLSHSE